MTQQPSDTAALGPMPEPEIEPKEPNPGGVDAVDHDDMPPAVHDLDPAENPAVEEQAPDEIHQLEDTGTAATNADGEEGSDSDSGSGTEEDPE